MSNQSDKIDAVAAAEVLGIKVKTCRKWTSERKIPFIRLSYRCVRYSRKALAEWLEKRTVSTAK